MAESPAVYNVQPLPVIAGHLAQALRNMPCTCIKPEQWPWKAPRTCAKCAALAEYDAFTAIVQVPR
jgi:hypothetical protein